VDRNLKLKVDNVKKDLRNGVVTVGCGGLQSGNFQLVDRNSKLKAGNVKKDLRNRMVTVGCGGL
jgi:hypothetical protein